MNKYPDIDKLSYDIGVLTIIQLITKYNISMKILEDVMHDKTDKFIKTYGIKAYDELEEMTLHD